MNICLNTTTPYTNAVDDMALRQVTLEEIGEWGLCQSSLPTNSDPTHPPTLCACGCGKRPKQKNSKYCRGHSSMTEESKRKNAEFQHKFWDPPISKKSRELISLGVKAHYSKPENRAAQSKRRKAYLDAHPEAKKKMSEERKKNWKDPKWRKKIIGHYLSSSIEVKVRNHLEKLGVEYEANVVRILGIPDIVVKNTNILIFCDGCFYHACKECRDGNMNMRFIKRRGRDKRITSELTKEGYNVIRIWEHEINNNDFSKIDEVLGLVV